MSWELLISSDDFGQRAALLEDGRLADYGQEGVDDADAARVGSIWRGRVSKVSSGMHAAFVDLGIPGAPQAFLSANELVAAGAKVPGRPDIAGVIKQGSTIVVQVVREASGSKGPRVSMSPSLTGAYSLLAPFEHTLSGTSRSLPGPDRTRLRELVPQLEERAAEQLTSELAGTRLVPARGFAPGVVLRTSAAGISQEDLEADVRLLAARFARIYRAACADGGPVCIAEGDGLADRALRRALACGAEALCVDDESLRDRLRSLISDLPEASRPRLTLEHPDPGTDLFTAHGLGNPEESLLGRVVTLSSGVWLAIDATEALTVIDVNSGHASSAGGSAKGNRALGVDLEAADEVARQIAARNITGALVIDFISLRSTRDRRQVSARLREALSRLGIQAGVGEMGSAGLVEVTRRGGAQPLAEQLTQACGCCGAPHGELTDQALFDFFGRKLLRVLATHVSSKAATVGVGSRLFPLVASPTRDLAALVERRLGMRVWFSELTPEQWETVRGHAADPLFADASFEVLSWGR